VTVVFNFEVDTAKLMRAIDTDDDVGAIVRLQFELDRALEHIVRVMVPDCKQLNHRYMDQRIRFLLSLGLPDIRVAPARVINNVRNSFAHREQDSFSTDDVARLHDAVAALTGTAIPTDFALINKKTDAYREWRYVEMTLKQKFCLLGFISLSGVATIENDFAKVAFTAVQRGQA
jgi:hypothetical protein